MTGDYSCQKLGDRIHYTSLGKALGGEGALGKLETKFVTTEPSDGGGFLCLRNERRSREGASRLYRGS